MSERERLVKAIAAVEAQRANLGDSAVDTVLAGLRQNLAELETSEHQIPQVDNHHSSAGERRIVTVLFCDVTGSTALAGSYSFKPRILFTTFPHHLHNFFTIFANNELNQLMGLPGGPSNI